MRMKSVMTFIAGLVATGLSGVLHADTPAPAPQQITLGIGTVRASKSMTESATGAGKLNTLQRVLEATDTHLMDRFNAARKFEIVARSHLGEIMKEIDLAGSGNLDKNDPKVARAMELAGCNYMLVTSIDNFNDFRDELVLEGGKKAGSKRIIQISAVAAIYNTTTGKLLETAGVKVEKKVVDMAQEMVNRQGDSSESLLSDAATELCEKIVMHVTDVLYPAKIVARTDKIVTINRGEGTSIALDQIYEVFALGPDLVDPDTGKSLGREEIQIGLVKVVRVSAQTSQAEILEDKGVDRLQVLRLKIEKKSE